MEQKPIKLDLNDGKLKQFSSTDDLPNQPDIEEIQLAFAELVWELSEMGIKFKSKRLLSFLKLIK